MMDQSPLTVGTRRDEDTEMSADEASPLLHHEGMESPDLEPKVKRPTQIFITALMCLLIVVVDAGSAMEVPALTQILENDVCWRHYARVGLPPDGNMNCTAKEIVKEVALIKTIGDSLDLIPGVVLSLPMGVLADRWGRKPVLLISLAGAIVSEAWVRVVCYWWQVFPTRLVWLSPLPTILGGGGAPVAASMIFVIIADIYAQEQRANVFYLIASSGLISNVFGSTVGAALVSKGYPWVTYMLSIAIMVIGMLGAIWMPETLDGRNKQDVNQLSSRQGDFSESTSLRAKLQAIHCWIAQRYEASRQATGFVWRNMNISLLMFLFFVGHLSTQSTVVLILYAQERFGANVGDAAFLLSISACASLAAFLILPIVSSLITTRWKVSAPRKDFLITIALLSLLVMGMLLVAFSTTVWLLLSGTLAWGFGTGYSLNARSLVTSLVRQNQVGTLYGAIAVVTSIGAVISGPMQAAAFNWGLDLEGYWLGMPFMLAAGLYAIALSLICMVKLPEERRVEVDDVEE